ncbi:MAG: symmetrical bis(5'-nucleosyl)-tetraphosphatase [Vicinamibacteria bacterium]
MATYAIGDVQGCFITLMRLLRRLEFDPSRDRLWMVGDLVNRGPDSLGVLRWVKSMEGSVVTVLGNHDLHLIARAEGLRGPRQRDTFDDVLEAPDREALIEWLVGRPLLHREDEFVLVHAGIHPSWSVEEAEQLSWEAQETLRSRRRYGLLEAMEEKSPSKKWDPGLEGLPRIRLVIDVFTHMRTVKPGGELCLDFAGPPQQAPEGCRPWFDSCSFPAPVTVLFGHWAALGLHLGGSAIGLDTGCAWGRSLTALRLEDRQVFQEPSELAS